MKSVFTLFLLGMSLLVGMQNVLGQSPRRKVNFDKGWRFHLGDVRLAKEEEYLDNSWRQLNLPHDWSIEGKFDKNNPAGVGGGALPGGIGWYRKTFSLPKSDSGNMIFIDFDGVYMNSSVWINGHYLGNRPYGYSSFRYNLTPFLHYGKRGNVIAVKVDNSKQPNSRWYSGSGIYRNVWLVTTKKVHVEHWGTYITTHSVSSEEATVTLKTTVWNALHSNKPVTLTTLIYDSDGQEVTKAISHQTIKNDSRYEFDQEIKIDHPELWSTTQPVLYKAVSIVSDGKHTYDRYETPFGIRHFHFDPKEGFFLNGQHLKINGVCDHHDLGSLGAAINTRAIQRQLQMLKGMGCNAIRTSHNPPAPELLQLCDKMGFLVMDEAFDCWKKAKNPYDYHLYWNEWHKRDLSDLIKRDRNHPSVIIWSIGNEIPEQHDSSGTTIARELAGIVRSLDTTRPITSAMNNPPGSGHNFIAESGALDLIGQNYHDYLYPEFARKYPDKKFIATETTSALESRGDYNMPSDSVFIWPLSRKDSLHHMNADFTCSSYDNCRVPWGSTHERTLKAFEKYDFVSGIFVWTGFDYLGEPTPYGWPARSSYFGIIDLAGFPKNAYYLYKSVWTDTPVLHIFPHWNWQVGDTVDVWAYYNKADEVELYLNGKSLGIRSKKNDNNMPDGRSVGHVMWRVPYEPGTLKAVSRETGKTVLTREIHTAGPAAAIVLVPDRDTIHDDGEDLSFVKVKIVDANGNLVPRAKNLVHFSVGGPGFIAGVDNGSETDHEPFKADYRKAYNGLCLAIIQSKGKAGIITLTAQSNGLSSGTVKIKCD